MIKYQFYIILTILTSSLFSLKACASDNQTDSTEFKVQRTMMVKTQIEARGVKDQQVLDAMLKVERHLFVPEMFRRYAYHDGPLPIDDDQTISQPYIVAIMTELLELDKGDQVLEIGTGSGYQAAILGELVDSVFTIEIVKNLADKASELLKQMSYNNVIVKHGDGFIGWDEHAPYDGIIVTCAPSEVPQPLIDQLAEGGRLVIPVGTKWQELLLIKKTDGEISKESIIPVRFVPMTGEAEETK